MKYSLGPLVASLALGAAAGLAQAYELRLDRSLVTQSAQGVNAQAYFDQPVNGDLYLAMKAYGRLFFYATEGFAPMRTPLIASGSFDGEVDLGGLSTEWLQSGSYPLYMVVTQPGANVMKSDNWVGGAGALESVRLTVTAGSYYDNDRDDDGWSDNDLDFDGDDDPRPTPPGANDPQILTPSAGRLLASQCAQCHGPDGVSYTDIDGLLEESDEIAEEFREYQYEENDIMHFQALGYTAQEVQSIAAWFSGLSTAGYSDRDDDDDDDDRDDDDREGDRDD